MWEYLSVYADTHFTMQMGHPIYRTIRRLALTAISCVNNMMDGKKASHHAVATCNDCHIPHEFVPKYITKLKNGFWHSKGFTLQDFSEPIRILSKNRVILQKNCLYCHGEFVSEIATHPGNDRQMLDCIHCHSSVGHGPSR